MIPTGAGSAACALRDTGYQAGGRSWSTLATMSWEGPARASSIEAEMQAVASALRTGAWQAARVRLEWDERILLAVSYRKVWRVRIVPAVSDRMKSGRLQWAVCSRRSVVGGVLQAVIGRRLVLGSEL